MNKYGPNTNELEKFIEKVKSLTPAEVKTFENYWNCIFTPKILSLKDKATARAVSAMKDNDPLDSWNEILDALYEVSRNREMSLCFSYGAWNAIVDAARALFSSDHISKQTFKMLYGPWASVMEVEP